MYKAPWAGVEKLGADVRAGSWCWGSMKVVALLGAMMMMDGWEMNWKTQRYPGWVFGSPEEDVQGMWMNESQIKPTAWLNEAIKKSSKAALVVYLAHFIFMETDQISTI